MRNKLLAIIPARGGSKGIPNKNIVDLNGKPLIYYTIEESLKAQKKGYIDKLIVSTDDEKICEISRKYGAEVPFIRPKEISGDKAKSIEYVLHALDFYKSKNEFFDTVMILQPTSPMRKEKDIIDSIISFNGHSSKSLVSCYEEAHIKPEVMYNLKDSILMPLKSNHNIGSRRQDVENYFIRNGAIYITKVDFLLTEQKIISKNPMAFVMKKSFSIDIDTLEDIELVRLIFENKLFS